MADKAQGKAAYDFGKKHKSKRTDKEAREEYYALEADVESAESASDDSDYQE